MGNQSEARAVESGAGSETHDEKVVDTHNIAQVDLDEARTFLDRLGGGMFGFQPYTDDETKPKPKADPFARNQRYGRLAHLGEELARFNKKGAAVAPIVNELNGKGFKADNVVRVRAAFADLDLPAREAVHALQRALHGALPPSIIVQTSLVRFHLYWVLADDMPLDRFGDVQRAIADRFGGDRSAVNLNRAMRCPGFVHAKDPEHPFRSRIVAVSDRRYTASEILTEFALEAAAPPASEPVAEFDATLLEDALKAIPADDRETYVTVVRASKLSAEEAGFPGSTAKEIVRTWAKTSDKYTDREFDIRWAGFKRKSGKVERLGTVLKLAADYGWRRPGKLSVEDFHAYMPMHNYIYAPTRDFWPAPSVNARVPKVKTPNGPVEAAMWIDRHRAVEQITWYPGETEVIEGRIIAEGGWIEQPGAKVFNLYRPAPPIKHGEANRAAPWREHLAKLYPSECGHIELWLAHRVQRPGEKINHGLILGGKPGVGKDSLLVPVKRAVGYWNMSEVSPIVLTEPFNDWIKSVILRVSEARDLGGNDLSATNRYALYEHMKTLTAAPPEVLRVNEKHLRQYAVPNVVGVVITTNYPDGMFLPPDDRRFFVAWSELTKDDFHEAYWSDLHAWYDEGGAEHVAAHLAAFDLSRFDPKAAPPWTAAKAAMVDAGRDDHLSPIGDALDRMLERGMDTNAVTTGDLVKYANSEALSELLAGSKNARRVPHLMEAWGYAKVVNEASPSDGKWRVDGSRQVVYVKRELSQQGRLAAARAMEGRAQRRGS